MAGVPVIKMKTVDHLKDGHIVTVEPRTGFVMTVFRPESRHNVIFSTERCNSNCLMCSQPPKDLDDSFRVKEHLRIISLIEEPPEFLWITGGEPTLLGDDLFVLLNALRICRPLTSRCLPTEELTRMDLLPRALAISITPGSFPPYRYMLM